MTFPNRIPVLLPFSLNVFAVLWPNYSLVVWRRPKLLAFRRLAETVLPELLWSKTIVLRDM